MIKVCYFSKSINNKMILPKRQILRKNKQIREFQDRKIKRKNTKIYKPSRKYKVLPKNLNISKKI